MYLFIHRLFRKLPPTFREILKSALNANGHRKSVIDKMRAASHASGKKRIDRVAYRIIDDLNKAGISTLAKQRCMEFGAGYVPTEVLVYISLGAVEVIAIDYNPIAQIEILRKALDLAPLGWENNFEREFARHKEFNLELISFSKGTNNIEKLNKFNYIAPFDMSKNSFSDNPFNFIHSVSVLEHLPLDCIQDIVSNLCQSLAPGGRMLNTIDLTDHWDADNNPFGFLKWDTNYNEENDYDTRGNRLRLSDWIAIFSNVKDCHTVCLSKRQSHLEFSFEELNEFYKSHSKVEISLAEITLLTIKK